MLKVKIISALPLTADEREQTRQKAKEIFKTKIDIDFGIDKNIIGGLIFKSDDKILNLSVAEKLNQLQSYLNL